MKVVDTLSALLNLLESNYESGSFDGSQFEKALIPLRSLATKNKSFAKVLNLSDKILAKSVELDVALIMELIFVLEGLIVNLSVEAELDLQLVNLNEERVSEINSDWFILQPLIKALELKGSGRLRLLEESIAFGTYKQRFLMPYIVKAAFDSYAPVSQLILQDMLPYFGASGLRYLSREVSFGGGAAEERVIIHLLSGLPSEERQTFLKRAFKSAGVKSLKCILSNLTVEDWMRPFLKEISEERRGTIAELADALLGIEGE